MSANTVTAEQVRLLVDTIWDKLSHCNEETVKSVLTANDDVAYLYGYSILPTLHKQVESMIDMLYPNENTTFRKLMLTLIEELLQSILMFGRVVKTSTPDTDLVLISAKKTSIYRHIYFIVETMRTLDTISARSWQDDEFTFTPRDNFIPIVEEIIDNIEGIFTEEWMREEQEE